VEEKSVRDQGERIVTISHGFTPQGKANFRQKFTKQLIKVQAWKHRKHKQDVKEIIHEIMDDSSEQLSYRGIATKLNNAGYKTARGSKFTAVQVMRALAA